MRHRAIGQLETLRYRVTLSHSPKPRNPPQAGSPVVVTPILVSVDTSASRQGSAMSKAQLVITAVVVEGRSKSDAARNYDLSSHGCTSWSNATRPRVRRRSNRAPAARMPNLKKVCAAAQNLVGFAGAEANALFSCTPYVPCTPHGGRPDFESSDRRHRQGGR